MKKLILSLLFVIITLCSCTTSSKEKTAIKSNPVTISQPTTTSLDDYKKPETDIFKNDVSQNNESNETYYANMNTKKFHTSACSSSKLIKEDNLYKSTSREQLINEGYFPCSRCNP